ncbi:class I SAM-dependent methyltransferase [Thermodesulfobacteriota bacterium]
MIFKVGRNIDDGYIDSMSVDLCGMLSLEGWSLCDDLSKLSELTVEINKSRVAVNEIFRTYRPDVAAKVKDNNDYLGFQIDFLVDDFNKTSLKKKIRIFMAGKKVFSEKIKMNFVPAHYNHLFDTENVLHRDDIYGYGPPSPKNCDQVISLAKRLDGPVLDFGCGSGYLVKMLRESGVEAYGIEIKRDAIVESLHPKVKEFVTLYDGALPLPYKDNEFVSVISSEVLEHIPDYEKALDEIARVTSKNFVMTVPEIASVPICCHSGVVPWHLLESTHVNFFTQRSLRNALSSRFNVLSISKINPAITNSTKWYGNLVAICKLA